MKICGVCVNISSIYIRARICAPFKEIFYESHSSQRYERHGQKGEIIEVNDGYARNFLIKKGIAQEGTQQNIYVAEQRKKAYDAKVAAERAAAQEVAAKLKNVTVKVTAKGGENNGKMFGSVTNEMISGALSELGFDVDKKKIETKESIRDFGTFDVTLRLYPEVTQVIKIEVVRA